MSEYIYEVTTDSDGVDCYIKRGEIVRCKDCKRNPNSIGWVTCPMTGSGTRKDDDYCSYGERK